jgi:hypothetical protein
MQRLRITASPYHDDALTDALAETLVEIWARPGLAEAPGSGSSITAGFWRLNQSSCNHGFGSPLTRYFVRSGVREACSIRGALPARGTWPVRDACFDTACRFSSKNAIILLLLSRVAFSS